MSTVKKKADETPPVVVRFPAAVVKRLDKVAARNGRSRSSEVRQRILASLAAEARS
ncbi:Arc family DNA-binding protein [Hydrogenophaga sp.]|uniref:Arc family DNA-binding protein n=1 Tax=Hydrogenophaga sp. TaxID=1904254 RepID=UPI003D15093F